MIIDDVYVRNVRIKKDKDLQVTKHIDGKYSYSNFINQIIDNYFTFSTTIYIIKHRLHKKFHIGYYDHEDIHDLHWHYIHNTGSGTVGDAIRKEGFSRFSFEVIGSFSNLKHAIKALRVFRDSYAKRGFMYDSYHPEDDVEVLIAEHAKYVRKRRREKRKESKKGKKV